MKVWTTAITSMIRWYNMRIYRRKYLCIWLETSSTLCVGSNSVRSSYIVTYNSSFHDWLSEGQFFFYYILKYQQIDQDCLVDECMMEFFLKFIVHKMHKELAQNISGITLFSYPLTYSLPYDIIICRTKTFLRGRKVDSLSR